MLMTILVVVINSFAIEKNALLYNLITTLDEGDNTSVSENSHIVKRRDTLWDLAQKYLGDAYKWDDIWKSNKHIRDPHWIYPGDALVISGLYDKRQDNISIEPTNELDYLRKEFTQETVVDNGKKDDSDNTNELYYSEINSLIKNGYFGSSLLRQTSFLWTKKDANDLIAPGNAIIDGDKKTEIYHQFSRVRCNVFGNHQYSIGDTVDVFHPERYVEFMDNIANLIKRVALGRVENVFVEHNEKIIEVSLFRVWDVVRNEDRIAPVKHFDILAIDNIYNTETVLTGKVFERVENSESPYLFQTFIINKGKNQGVKLGDIFEVFPGKKEKVINKATILSCAINIQNESSTLIIIRMYENKLSSGDRVKLARRIKFN